MAVTEISADELQRLTAEGRPLLIDFIKDDCTFCDRLEPELERVAADWGEQLDIVKVQVEQAMEAAAQYQLRGTPTLILLRDGETLGRKSGFQRAQQLDAFLKHHLA